MKNKRLKISNRLSYTLIALFAVIFLGVGVFAAVTAGSTPDPGHNIDFIGAPEGCVAGEYLKYTGEWDCDTPSSGLPSCSSDQVLSWTGSSWGCEDMPTQGVAIHLCPVDPLATNYCDKVQLTRNGRAPCIGQLTTSSTPSCYRLDANCNFIEEWVTCPRIGYLVN